MTAQLIHNLRSSGVLGPPDSIKLVETHISWVLLTRKYAYKIKKPVNLGFLDFTTASSRKYYCDEELRLNRRLAPDLYLKVVTISGSPETPVIDNSKTGFDFAVKMRRFDRDCELAHVIETDIDLSGPFRELARTLVEFHRNANIADPGSNYGVESTLRQHAGDNFSCVADELEDAVLMEKLGRLQQWTMASFRQNHDLFEQRKQTGRVRECHGDLHLGNLVLLDHRIVPFDCLEFSESLRWIDTASEVAFLFMDLCARNREQLAWPFLNQYLEFSGDYGILGIFRHYLVYRAMVRFKVTCLSKTGKDINPVARNYLLLAEKFAYQSLPLQLIVTHGLSGCGKTWLTDRILESAPVIRIRTDLLRKLDDKLAPESIGRSGSVADRYSEYGRSRVYARAAKVADSIMDAGYPVVVDATFLHKKHRDQFRKLAAHRDYSFRILDVDATFCTLVNRIRDRTRINQDDSEADVDVLISQMKSLEPLEKFELQDTIKVDTTGNLDPSDISKLAKDLDLTI